MIVTIELIAILLWFVAFMFGNKPLMAIFIAIYWIAFAMEHKGR